MIYRDTNIRAARAACNRRPDRRDTSGGRGGGASPAAFGTDGFVTSTNYLRSAVGDIAAGDASGFFTSLAIHVLSVPTAQSFPFICWTTGKGWIHYTAGTVARTFTINNGVGTLVHSPTHSITSADIGKILLVTGWYDSTAGKVRQARSGYEIAAGTAITGYTPASAGERIGLGASGTGGTAAPWARIVGALYGTGIPTAADLLTHYNASVAARGMALMGGVGVTNVNRWQASGYNPAGASWADDVGAMALAKVGTLTTRAFAPVWERTPAVVLLGDSITAAAGYRAQLFTDAGPTIKSLGAYVNGTYPGEMHSGVSGDSLVQMEARVAAGVTAFSPRLIIVHGGTNDVAVVDGATTATRLASLLAALRAANPTAYIVVCKIPPRLTYETQCTDYNALIAGVCAAVDSKCIAIDPALVAGDLVDGIHPTAAGYIKLGDAIWNLGVAPIYGAL